MGVVINSIETFHKGWTFRSRLEARWAVFMETMGVDYLYEKETFDLDGLGWYLPDFWLIDLDCWLEIKPVMPSELEEAKCMALASLTEKRVFCSYQSVPTAPDVAFGWGPAVACYSLVEDGVSRDLATWCLCPACKSPGIAIGGDGSSFSRMGLCKCENPLPEPGYDPQSGTVIKLQETFADQRLLDAYRTARSVRF